MSAVVIAAAAVTFAAAAVGPPEVGEYIGGWDLRAAFWLADGLAFVVVAAIVIALALGSRIPRLLHLAVAVPISHVVAISIAWVVWRHYATVPRLEVWGGYARAVPVIEIGLVIGASVIAAAAVHAAIRRRVAAALHGVVLGALLALLFLGLWLPIAVGVAEAGLPLPAPPGASGPVAEVVIPPLALAMAVAVAITWCPAAAARMRRPAVVLCGVAVAVVAFYRAESSDTAHLLYANFVPVLLAAMIVAVSAITALGLATAIARRRARTLLAGRTLSGPIEAFESGADQAVAHLEITGWLRGPRIATTPFAVATPSAIVPVPPAVEVVAAIPTASVGLAVGESTAILVAGDHVRLAGYVDPPDAAPYRGAIAPVPGPDGVVVAPVTAADPAGGFTDITLAVWRPCVAYLLIVAAIGLPAVFAGAS